ncbi:MAG: hypothetical protein GF346_02905 [Candidatus Eisenbacteria bacterium]|nr:hypothetical protein [Candidatus Latescibacterota bacterium]MBD3301370.1 hypothetical protein [Candidatus Eisenbacteria bacterium]
MLRNPLFATLLFLVSIAAVATAGSPYPDPAERAAFQKLELERFAGLHDAWSRPLPADQEQIDALYYRLALDLTDVDGRWIEGDLTARFEVVDGPLETILLDFETGMQVDSVFVGGAPAAFSHGSDLLQITADPSIPEGGIAAVRVVYQGRPIGSFDWSDNDGVPVISTLSEPIGARNWWPCKDSPHDKADSLDVLLRVPDVMIATSNGLLAETIDHQDGSITYHWVHRYPITTYLVSIAATDYVRIEDWYDWGRQEPLLLEHFVYPEKLEAAEEDFSITGDAIAAMEELFGLYPFPEEKYGHSLFPWGGAMEHQTNTSYGANLVRGDHAYDWILVHELGHQWWGDMTSPADWRDIWLNEGFASYCEALWFEHLYGFDGLRTYMVDYQSVHDPSGPIYDPDYIFDGNTVYNKGAWAVHMLRGVLGDAVFFDALAAYRAATEYRSTTTAEFQAIVEDVAGQDLDWYFVPWIYGINRPHYEVSFDSFEEDGDWAVAVHLEQTQTEWDFFPMPVDLEITLAGGGTVRERFFNDPDHLDVEFRYAEPATAVAVDPDDWILKEETGVAYTLNVTTTDLSEGTEGMAYEQVLQARGGTAPYVWQALDPLPPGIVLDPDEGRLAGTAPEEGTYVFRVRVTDAALAFDDQRYEWTVRPPATDVAEEETSVPALQLRAGPVPTRGAVDLVATGLNGRPATIGIYDPAGRRVRTLWNGTVPEAGIRWDGKDDRGVEAPAGIYLVRMAVADRELTRRIVRIP